MKQASEPVSGGRDGIDPRRLLIFREVARLGSLSAAAAALGWTQPAVGQHVQRLERDVGLPLALRSTRGVTLTDAGTVLLGHADAVASQLSAAQEQMRALRTLRTGRLRLAAFPSACATLVPSALGRLAVAAPDLDVWLTELEPPEARAAVLAGEADLALLFAHLGADGQDEHRDLTAHDLFEDPVLAVLPVGHRLAGRADSPAGLDLAELAGDRWVAGCPRCRTHLQALAAGAGFRPDVRHSTDDYVVVQNLVAEGLAVALLPGLALAAARDERVVAVRIAGDPVRRISLVHRREAAATPSVRAGVQALAPPPHRNGVDRLRQAAHMAPVDLAAVLATLSEPWSPRTVATLNDYDVRVVKTHGEFTQHSHPETDEFFLVLEGRLVIEMADGDVELGAGQAFVVPRGVPHRPVSTAGAQVLLIEPSATVNTGDTPSPLTAPRRVV